MHPYKSPFSFTTPSGQSHTIYTSSHANAPQSIANAMHRRSISGMGLIATPYYPYNEHSVWNRNQLGDIVGSILNANTIMLLVVGYIGYKLATGKKIF